MDVELRPDVARAEAELEPPAGIVGQTLVIRDVPLLLSPPGWRFGPGIDGSGGAVLVAPDGDGR